MSRISSAINRIWNLRTSESRATRVWWWVGAICLAFCVLLGRSAGVFLFVLWACFNIGFGCACFVWMLFHARTVLSSSGTATAWSRWLTVVASFGIYIGVQRGDTLTNPASPAVLLLLILAASPFIFSIFLMFSLFGASIGAFMRRAHHDIEQSATAAVVGWWISIVAIVVVVIASDAWHLPGEVVGAMIVGLPVLSGLTSIGLRRVYVGEARAPLRIVDSALQRLVFSMRIGKRTRKIDLRGVAIGVVTASGTLWIAPSIILPAQQSVLGSMIRLRRQLTASVTLAPTPASRVVLVSMDASSAAEALTDASEAAIQARMIRRLTRAGVAAIVLPAPVVDLYSAPTGDTTEAAVNQTVLDIPDLADAMRESGHVVLSTSAEQYKSPALKPLIKAAVSVGEFGETPYGPAQIPSLPLKWQGRPPVTFLTLAAISGKPLQITPGEDPTAEQLVNGISVPTVFPYRAVFDLRTDLFAKEELATFSFSSILDGAAQAPADPNASGTPTLDSYLAGKVVFLEPIVRSEVDTPLGLLSRYSLLARVTRALLSDSAIKPGSRAAGAIWTLLLGVLIGALCAGRDPLHASWRVALLMFVNFGYSFLAYLGADIWADPVIPLVTATVAFLLVTQFTFALERDERNRNRALFSRFIAREFVDELLQSNGGKLALGGEKRLVCVLFADVRNFTGFAESHRPEEVIEIMNIYLTALTNALDAYGGLLDKYTGDGLMAFFEIKGDVRQELVRSVNASLAMRDAALEASQRMRQEGRHALDIGIGMHYGEAVVGLVGNEQRQINYTALGHTVVVSARLQTLAEGGEVVVSEPVFAAVRDEFDFVLMEPVFVKGISTEQRPYRVSGARTNSSPLAGGERG